MSVTAKDIAKKLNISPAAVSMALNGKPGVSTKTRKKIKNLAEEMGYDFTKIREREIKNGSVYFIVYMKNKAVVRDTPFFQELSRGVEEGCANEGFKLITRFIYEENLEEELKSIDSLKCIGLIILGTEISAAKLKKIAKLKLPMVLLDSYIEPAVCDSVLINNKQGAFLATDYLIHKIKDKPGYLSSSYEIGNFNERKEGFEKALKINGLSIAGTTIHQLPPSSDGAYQEMKLLLNSGQTLARGYFADNDLIAAGAMRAILESGLSVPEDVALVGFDNMPISRVLTPPLTTMHVPKTDLGIEAVLRLKQRIRNPKGAFTKTEITTTLIERASC